MSLKGCGLLVHLSRQATSLIPRKFFGGAFLFPGILFLVVVYSSLGFVNFTLETS